MLVSDQHAIIGGGSEAYLIQRAVGRCQDPKIRFRDPASYVARETGRAASARPPAAGKGAVQDAGRRTHHAPRPIAQGPGWPFQQPVAASTESGAL